MLAFSSSSDMGSHIPHASGRIQDIEAGRGNPKYDKLYALDRLRIQSWKIPLFFDYGKGRQHFLLSPLDYPPARTVGAVNGGRSPFTCC